MRAECYYLGCENRASNSIPAYVTKDGNRVLVLPGMNEELGVLVRVDATPDSGKIITSSHGELITGQWVEVIDEQKTVQEVKNAAAIARNKFTKLQIRRAMRSLGNEAILDGLLQVPAFAKDWSDAVEIDMADEITAAAIAQAGIDIDTVKLAIAGILPEPAAPATDTVNEVQG